ncbi:MAG TPA: response regulator [Verrucomicrobiae bacterium]|nr:response regulator [Verrucomicrobiae bacterium]
MSTPLRVLIVEDSEDDTQLIVRDLRRAGYDVTHQRVETAEAMAAALKAQDWDLIISDHRMPHFSSLAALKLYREHGCDVPFIVVSGSIGEELAVSAMKGGAHDYIMKDNLARLVPAVEREVREADERRQGRQAERALAESRRRMESILESAGEGICGLDAQGMITFINPRGAKLIGWKSEELIGQSLHEVVHHTKPDGTRLSQEECSLCATLRDGLVHWMDGEVFWRKDGSQFPVEYTGTPIREQDKMVGAVLTFQDISQRRGAETALQESNRQLEQTLAKLREAQQQIVRQERLRALGQMASGVAHDFNNALSKILGFTELMLTSPDKLHDQGQVQEHLRMISAAAQDAASVVRRLRTFYRPRRETEVFEPVDLNTLIQQAIALTQPKWKQQPQADGITVEIRTELQSVPLVMGDEGDLREVLTNLIFNAVDAMPKGGVITFRTRGDGEFVAFECSDTGIGMTPETRERCLEPFFTTKGEHGTGLGLSIVYGIIQRHGGSLDIQSEWGQGSTFIVRLPVHADQPLRSPEPQSVAQADPLQVLVVEDDALIREIEAEYLVCDGHAVETAASGGEGLKKFYSKRFDLVLSDRAMPEMNGDQLAGVIKTMSPDTPVILVTGFADALDGSGARPASVDQVLAKPFTHEALRKAVAMAAPKNGKTTKGKTNGQEANLGYRR